MNKTTRRGKARLVLLPIVAAAAPLSAFVVPVAPAAATTEAPAPALPSVVEKFRTDGWINGVAVSSTGRVDVLTDFMTLVRIEGSVTTTITLAEPIFAIASGPGGVLHGISETIDGTRLVTIADDGTTTAVGQPLGDFMHMMMMEGPSLQFGPDGAATLTMPFGIWTPEGMYDVARMAEDGSWEYIDIPSDGAIVGLVPQADGSLLYRVDGTGNLYRYTPGVGNELVADLPDGYFLSPHRGAVDLAGTTDGTVYFMDGTNVQRRLPNGTITTVGTFDGVDALDIIHFESPRIVIGSEGRLFAATMNVVYQLDLDLTAPTITVVGLTNGATLTQGKDRQITIKCDDTSPMAACDIALDGKSVETVSLSGLDRGQHRLVVEATDVLGNSSSKTIEFNVVGAREILGDLSASTGTDGTVARLYMAVFSRQPDGLGQSYWVAQHRSGTALQTIAKMFVTSSEFRTTYDDLDDNAFLTVLYRNVMDREPDAAGLMYWKSLIDAGLSRAETTLWFSESAEFQQLTYTS